MGVFAPYPLEAKLSGYGGIKLYTDQESRLHC